MIILNKKETIEILKSKGLNLLWAGSGRSVEEIFEAIDKTNASVMFIDSKRHRSYVSGATNLKFRYPKIKDDTGEVYSGYSFLDTKPIKNSVFRASPKDKRFKGQLIINDKESDSKVVYLVYRGK